MTVPNPWHAAHGWVVMTWPRNDRATRWTEPRPPHTSQVRGDVPGNPEKRRAYDLGGDPSSPGGGMGGGFGFQDIFETFFGAATGAAAQRGPIPRARRGQDALVRLDLDLADVTFGVHKDVPVDTAVVCPTCSGSCCRPGTSPRTAASS